MKLQRIISLRMSGDDVRFLQNKLKEFGIFRERIDGVVGPQTWSQLLVYNPNPTELQVENARLESELPKTVKEIPLEVSYVGENGLVIYDCSLTDEEYNKKQLQKNTIWLHHTAGGSRPDWTIGSWEKDYIKDSNGDPVLDSNGNTKELKVATHYVIGRSSSSSSDILWDGKILKAFDDRYWAYHLGISSQNSEMLNSRSISIEVCNYGPLRLTKDGKFINYVNRQVDEKDVVKLDKPFRGYSYYEKYTDKQIEALYKLIMYLKTRWNIKIDRGIYDADWFNYDEKWFSTGGLRSHGQVRKDKFDLFPQKELIEMLNSL